MCCDTPVGRLKRPKIFYHFLKIKNQNGFALFLLFPILLKSSTHRMAHGTRKRTLNRNKTRKSKTGKATSNDLQMLAKKYLVSKSGSTNQIANRLVELRGAIIKSKKERSIIEQFLKKSTPSTKRWGFVPA